MRITNIYVDESSHLMNDGQPKMVLGAVASDISKVREISKRLYEIRERHHIPRPFEAKWTNVSPSKLEYYIDLVDYFFDDDDLVFRTVVADKTRLNHEKYVQTHDDWYYKMMYQLLIRMMNPTESAYRVYLDKKDTNSSGRVKKLEEVLSNSVADFDREIIDRVQVVQSHDVIQMQLADVLIGAVSYANKGLSSSQAKLKLVDRVKERSGYNLGRSTLLLEKKFNIFHWSGQ